MAMEIGISTASFFGKKYTEDTIALIESMDIKVAEVFLTTFMEYEADFVRELNSRRKTLRIHSVHSLTNQFEPQLFNSAERTRLDSVIFYEKLCNAAKIMDAKYYTFHGPSNVKKTPVVVNYEKLTAQLTYLTELAAKYGVSLSYENVHWTLYAKPSFISPILPKVPLLRTTLDIKQAMQSGIDYVEYLNAMGDRLSTVHVCDYDANGLLKVPGEGTFDFQDLISRLKDMNYQNPIMIELYSNDYTSFDQVKRSYDMLSDILYHTMQR